MMKSNLRMAKDLIALAKQLVADGVADRIMQQHSFANGYDFATAKKNEQIAFIFKRDNMCPEMKITVSGDTVTFMCCTIGMFIAEMSDTKSYGSSQEEKDIYNEAFFIYSMQNMQKRGIDLDKCSKMEKYDLMCGAAMNLLKKNPNKFDAYKGRTWTTTKQEAYDILVGKCKFHTQEVSKFLGVEASSENTFDCGKFKVRCPEDFKESATSIVKEVCSCGIPENLLYGNVEFIPVYETANLIVEGDYEPNTDSLRITMEEEDLLAGISPAGAMVHELGHRWWYKFANDIQKTRFRMMYFDAKRNRNGCFLPTTYSGECAEEFVGDCFRCYYYNGLKEGTMKESIKAIINNEFKKNAEPKKEENTAPAMDVSEMEKKQLGSVFEMNLGEVTFKDVFKNNEYVVNLPVHLTEKGYNEFYLGLSKTVYLSNDKKTIYFNATYDEEKSNSYFDDAIRSNYNVITRALYNINKDRQNNEYKIVHNEEAYQKKKPSNPKFVVDTIKKKFLNNENNIYWYINNMLQTYFTKINNVSDFIDKFDTFEDYQKAYPKFNLEKIGNIIKETFAYKCKNSEYFSSLKAKYKLDESNIGIISDEISKYLTECMSRNEKQYIDACNEIFYHAIDFDHKYVKFIKPIKNN
jgi:hypothetical protein